MLEPGMQLFLKLMRAGVVDGCSTQGELIPLCAQRVERGAMQDTHTAPSKVGFRRSLNIKCTFAPCIFSSHCK